MEIIFEILFELYLGFAEMLVPEHKFKKWQETLLKITSLIISLAILACLFAGIVFLTDTDNRMLGTILTAVGGGLLAIQIAIFVIVLVHQIKKEKAQKTARKNKKSDNNNTEDNQLSE